MSEENVELVRRIHEAWDRHEFKSDLVAEDVEYVNPDYAVVVALVHYTALGPGSGVELSGELGYIWTLKDGLAVRFRWFASHREALNAVGIYED